MGADDSIELEVDSRHADETGPSMAIQSGAYLLELSLDWIVLRASENIQHLLRESHLGVIDEPLGKFVQPQALHDLRNLFARLSGSTGIGRAYAVRLTDEPDLVDIAFQLVDGRVLLEAVPSAGSFGECFGSVGGLIEGLFNARGQALLDGAARRMRALTGYDRVTLVCGEERSESSRGEFARPALVGGNLPTIICDSEARSVRLYRDTRGDSGLADALMRSCAEADLDRLRSDGIRAVLRVPFSVDDIDGEFRCDSRTPRQPSFEMHAAAELFAQLVAMRLELDRLRD